MIVITRIINLYPLVGETTYMVVKLITLVYFLTSLPRRNFNNPPLRQFWGQRTNCKSHAGSI